MQRAFSILAFVLVATPYLAVTACSSSSDSGDAGGGGGSSSGGTSSSSSGGSGSGTVSFKSDIIPIFQTSCALGGAACHGDPSVTQTFKPYLGIDPSTGGNAASAANAVYQGLVGVKSSEDPTMNQITKGDKANSFLWHKMMGDQGTLAAQCASTQSGYTNCGAVMPFGLSALPQATLNKVSAWITAGALNN
jgi:hypothetical protein